MNCSRASVITEQRLNTLSAPEWVTPLLCVALRICTEQSSSRGAQRRVPNDPRAGLGLGPARLESAGLGAGTSPAALPRLRDARGAGLRGLRRRSRSRTSPPSLRGEAQDSCFQIAEADSNVLLQTTPDGPRGSDDFIMRTSGDEPGGCFRIT